MVKVRNRCSIFKEQLGKFPTGGLWLINSTSRNPPANIYYPSAGKGAGSEGRSPSTFVRAKHGGHSTADVKLAASLQRTTEWSVKRRKETHLCRYKKPSKALSLKKEYKTIHIQGSIPFVKNFRERINKQKNPTTTTTKQLMIYRADLSLEGIR